MKEAKFKAQADGGGRAGFWTALTGLTIAVHQVNSVNLVRCQHRQSSQHRQPSQHCPKPNAAAASPPKHFSQHFLRKPPGRALY